MLSKQITVKSSSPGLRSASEVITIVQNDNNLLATSIILSSDRPSDECRENTDEELQKSSREICAVRDKATGLLSLNLRVEDFNKHLGNHPSYPSDHPAHLHLAAVFYL